ncbi:iron complex transport system ATP-binding protein [Desulfocicer vacuolatum DSM 3385]|uniref:Iron complex transport system ATP-binding protein n=1 Tax=Desulfocicer vacuolatum DSM 3385 TaxID=1121400 RepID=A0A1W2EVF1_9BACT|nr:ABC transporter ATP-binding protein [Desulfocicer vacuolatum]SMD13186.1 iron complex transport system ATP-binding protein [Desulfocicer vacuolatum DSM 3385]
MAVALECRNLFFSHGNTPVLKGISLAMKSSTFTAILGRNGSGKTTLLHCLNGIRKANSGTVHIKGTNIQTLSRKQVAQHISLVIQENPEVFPFTVLDVVVMGRAPFLGATQVPGTRDYKLAKQALETLDVAHLAEVNFNRISGGERQMALLACALVQTSDIMLLDEPTNHLDFKNQYLLLNKIKQLCRQSNTAVVAAMHDPNMAMLFADEVILLKKGVIFGTGPVRKVMTKANMDQLYETDTTALPFVRDGHFFIPTDVIETIG